MNKQNKTEMILKGSIYKVLITLSIPIMINSLIQTLYNLVDGLYVSMISSVHFAATAFVWPVNFLFISLGIGLSIAGTSLLSQLIGGDKIKEAKEYSTQLMAVTLLASIVFTIMGYIISPTIIRLMGATGDLAELGNIYLRITFLDMPFMFLFFNINSMMNAQGDTITPTVLSGISAIINVILDPIFIFTFDMGIAGAAWATLISRAILAVVGFMMLFSEKNKIRPNFRGFKFNGEIIKEIVTVGLPSTIGQSGASLGFIVLNGFIGSYGTATIAAYAMVNRITSLVMQPAMGLGSALTAIVGQNMGANQIDRVKEAFHKALKLTIIIGSVGCILLIVFDNPIINFFMQSKDDPSVIELSLTYLFYISLSMPLMGIFSVLQGLFQGSGNTKYSMAMEVGRLWFVRLPMILIFKHLTNWGSSGIWFSMSFSNLIVCLYGYWIYRGNGWQKRVIKLDDECQGEGTLGIVE
ncbi:MATE family efflux transporter [Tissierella carlieri]|jgi:putative MATE family efflux protein|uniref:MATE family efflux transporter n=1 Tax=Tissierella TaxID=41273 RepID=UPI001C10B892|nr:MATE family efflux transporter [Tissierella carlieri]MBU5311631.1 MATE family efflux transporter [Tissierella carlieri]